MSTFKAEPTNDPEGRPFLRVQGEIDLATAPRLVEAAEKLADSNRGDRLGVDLSDVSFMDSTGLGALIKIRNVLVERGGELQIAGCSRAAERAFELAGLTDIFRAHTFRTGD